MKIQTATLLAALMIGTTAGCASDNRTATERDFGDSVRSMIADQTANPYPAPPGEETGDGVRLENVLDAYRSDVGSRSSVGGRIDIDPNASE